MAVISTYGCIVAKHRWYLDQLVIARIQVLDSRRMTGSLSPSQHIGMVRQAWKRLANRCLSR